LKEKFVTAHPDKISVSGPDEEGNRTVTSTYKEGEIDVAETTIAPSGKTIREVHTVGDKQFVQDERGYRPL
jgi:hypothetical protein